MFHVILFNRKFCQYRQHYQAVCQQRLPAAPDRAAGLSNWTTSACAAPAWIYHEYATLKRHPDLQSCLDSLGQPRLFAFTTKGSSRSMRSPTSPVMRFLSAGKPRPARGRT